MENSKFEVKNLNLHYGAFHALKNINMDIAKNEILHLSVHPAAVNQHF